MSGILSHPEYLHVLLNPIPVYGLACGLFALMLGFVMKSRPARIVALALVSLSAASAWPVSHFGEKAYDNVMMAADDAGVRWMDDHKARAEKVIIVFYALAILALAAIVLPLKWPHADLPLSCAALATAIAVLAMAGWIAYAGGRIRHSEFRAEAKASE
jgi:hypothetical protein